MARPHSEAIMSKSSFLLFNHKSVKAVTSILCLIPKAEEKKYKILWELPLGHRISHENRLLYTLLPHLPMHNSRVTRGDR